MGVELKKTKVIGLLILIMLLVFNYCPQQTIVVSSVENDLLDGGYIIKDGEVTILHVSGSHYQMGFQHGSLLFDKVQENIRAYLSNAPTDHSHLLSI